MSILSHSLIYLLLICYLLNIKLLFQQKNCLS
nr:MAG TPA: hypothetical protein [Caudoviricetes sp.]DAW76926.1 MAG TPA: hypothetical protein [Caudoviricetes sp.]